MALPSFPPFAIADSETSTASRWKRWNAKLENLMLAMNITNEARKKALLLHYGGDELFDLIETFTDDQKQDYASLVSSLRDYFNPKTNVTFESFKLRQMTQSRDETVDQFYVRLKMQAQLCDFHDVEREILAQLIEGTCSSHLRRKALRENLDMKKFLAEARNEELTSKQAREIESSTTRAQSVQFTTTKSHNQHKHPVSKPPRKPTQSQSTVCRNCGGKFPHAKQCPAKGQTCHNCG